MRWILIVAIVFFVGCEKKDEIKKLKSDIAELKFEVEMLKSQNSNKKVDNTDKSTKKLEAKIEELNKEIFVLKDSFSNLSKKVEDINKSITVLPSSPINCKGYFKPTTFITKKEAKIYNSKGEVVTTWPKCKTFTSYIEKNGRLKITGIFVHAKWQDARAKDWWIDVKDVAKKFKDKNESKNMRDN